MTRACPTRRSSALYWTMGDPPRRYQVIGIIRDKRGDGPLSGDAIGSKSVAKATLKAGGDAVIYLSSNSRVTGVVRSEEHTSELQSLMRISYAVFCLKINITIPSI